MLSRVAASLYGLGREMERADHLARLTDEHLALWLDRAGGRRDDMWSGVLRIAGWVDVPARAGAEALVADEEGPSVRHSIGEARALAQAVRPSLSSEVYEQVNTMFLRVYASDWRRDVHELLSQVELGVHLVDGLIEETMVHDEAWDFLRLGKRLERARNVTRLVTGKVVELGQEPDPAEWATVLRSCSAFESYRMRFAAPVTPARLVAYLLLDTTLPRSAGYCIRQALASVARIDGPGGHSRPHRLLGQLGALFEFSDEEEVAAAPVDFSGTFGRFELKLEEALTQTYFQPSRVAARVHIPSPAWASQQQQQ